MAPELPEMFSTTTGWPHAFWNFSANMRAVTSVALPAVKPTTSLTGFSGQLVWAKADQLTVEGATKNAHRKRAMQFICFLPLCEAMGFEPVGATGQRVQSPRQLLAATLVERSVRLRASDTNSLGIITIVMVFCSAPTSVIICIRLSSNAEGFCMMTSAALRNCSAAASSAGFDEAGPLLAERFCLLGHGALHRRRNFHALH